MYKMSMSVSPYGIAQFVNFILKNKKTESDVPLVCICDEGEGLHNWWVCISKNMCWDTNFK